MGLFRVTQGPNGLSTISQVATPRPTPRKPRATVDDEIAKEVDEALRAELEDEGASAARAASTAIAAELVAGLHENNVSWALERIPGLLSEDQVEQVRAVEEAHPKHPGGRAGVLNGLNERLDELEDAETEAAEAPKGPGDLQDPVPEHPAGGGLPCPECDFLAGSQAGLDAHMESVHDDADIGL